MLSSHVANTYMSFRIRSNRSAAITYSSMLYTKKYRSIADIAAIEAVLLSHLAYSFAYPIAYLVHTSS